MPQNICWCNQVLVSTVAVYAQAIISCNNESIYIAPDQFNANDHLEVYTEDFQIYSEDKMTQSFKD